MKRNRLLGLLILAGGWGLGWISHGYWSASQPQAHRDSDGSVSGTDTVAIAERAPSTLAAGDGQSASVSGVAQAALEFERLLRSGRFEEASQRLVELRAQQDEATVQRYRSQLLQHARGLFSQARHAAAERLLKAYLVEQYRDVEALELLADVHHRQHDYAAEIDVLYQARSHAYRSDKLAAITSRIHATVAEYAAALKAREDQRGLLELYETLTSVEADYAPYFMGMAEAQLALQDPEGARLSLSLIAHDPQLGKQARQMLASLQPGADVTPGAAAATIPLVQSGDHFLVEVWIDRRVRTHLLIDTGASITIINPEVLARAGATAGNEQGQVWFNTVNGRLRAPVYTVAALSVGDHTLPHVQVGGVELSSATGAEGLLGMNFLRHYHFFIDQFEGVLRLTPRSRQRPSPVF